MSVTAVGNGELGKRRRRLEAAEVGPGEGQGAPVQFDQLARDRQSEAVAGASSSRRRPGLTTSAACSADRPGPWSSMAMSTFVPVARDRTRTVVRAHLQALSSRLPSILSRSCASQAKALSGPTLLDREQLARLVQGVQHPVFRHHRVACSIHGCPTNLASSGQPPYNVRQLRQWLAWPTGRRLPSSVYNPD